MFNDWKKPPPAAFSGAFFFSPPDRWQQESMKLEVFHLTRLLDCIGSYFSHTNPSDLMRLHLHTFPSHEDLSGDKRQFYFDKIRAAVEVFQFLSHLEKCYINYLPYSQVPDVK